MRILIIGCVIFNSCYLFSQNEVIYIWSGALTSNSIRVNAKMSDTSSTIRLLADEDSTFASPFYSTYYSVDSSTNYMVSMTITGLLPQTKYFYAVESAGVIDSSSDDVGSFTTFANGPFSYLFVFGSCSVSSDHPVYDVMKSMQPSFYMNTGDLHYDNPNSATDINVHRAPYEARVLSHAPVATLFKKAPVVYMWDDHDYCGNDTDSSSLGRANARIAYHEYVPHYPLAFGSGATHPINQSFTAGRIHFILTDLRSQRSGSSMMGDEQKAWFENECIYARDNGLIIAWISSSSWMGTAPDTWSYWAPERTELSDFFNNYSIQNMFLLCGDSHMLAIDNGTNADYTTGLNSPYRYPVFQAAALNNNGSNKGGTYSEGGCYPNPLYTIGQFGQVNVNDSGGDSICISFSGYRVDSAGTTVTMMNSYSFCRHLSAVSIAEPVADAGVIVQPNPSAAFDIVFKEKTMLRSVKIFSSDGKLVFSQSKLNEMTMKHPVAPPAVKAGCYIIEIGTDKGIVKRKWIKN